MTNPSSRKYLGQPEKNERLNGRVSYLIEELDELAGKNKALADSKELKDLKEAFNALTEGSPTPKKAEYA
ncbi:MAG: hypothetical protein K2X93_18300 [Candidatus Obscuribacterales bacterium]|nr:hypothetical protein [Candidatus Obscuribacterales bacterium]